MDFTLKAYLALLNALLDQNYSFQSFQDFLSHPQPKSCILRHDVDLRPKYALRTAEIEHALGITGSYYFRIVPESFDEKIIQQIASLGHEIGYHYEDLTLARGNMEKAIDLFAKNLQTLRAHYPVSTACMHGSPASPWDSKDLWKHYHYRDFGIIGEPYLDIDFSKVLYLTDTGRRWDAEKSSVRDKVEGESVRSRYHFHSTFDIIRAAVRGELPQEIMITLHPQRWTDRAVPWMRELVVQNMKNVVKRNKKLLQLSRKLNS